MSTPAGWYPDPTGRHQNRWFDGDDWTDSVADGQTVGTDPVKGGGTPATDAGATQVISTPPQQPAAPGESVVPTQATPAAGPPPTEASPPVGAAGASAPPGAPLGTYAGPPGAPSAGRKSKTGLILAVAVILIAVVVGIVLLTQGGDDGGSDSASSNDESADQSDEPEEDPSASDLFDDMADEADGGDSGDSSDDVFGTDDEPPDAPDATTVGGAYPQEVIDNFNNSCTGAGGPADFCQCIIDVLQRDVAYDRFVEIDAQLAENPDDIPPELDAAVSECQAG